MKLVLCRNCQDIFRLIWESVRTCKCGCCSGKYLDHLDAVYSGENAVPLGFSNDSLVDGIYNQPDRGKGYNVTAFIIPKYCHTMKKISEKEMESIK